MYAGGVTSGRRPRVFAGRGPICIPITTYLPERDHNILSNIIIYFISNIRYVFLLPHIYPKATINVKSAAAELELTD